MDSSTLITIITALAALIGAASPIIVSIIQSNKDKPQKPSGLYVPDSYILHHPKTKIRWFVVLAFSLLGGIIGFSGAKLASPSQTTEMPTITLNTQSISETPAISENTNSLTPPPVNSRSASTPPVLGNLLFDDDFSTNNNLWATGKDDKSEVYIENGEYHIIGGTWVGLSKSNAFEDFYLETKIKRLSDHAQSTDYGVFFRQTESINYLFVINPDQQSYALLRVYMPTDQNTDLIPWVYSPRISTGVEENKIGILCSGNTITMYINGYRVDSIQDSNSLTGNFGFVGGSEAHIAVDYLRIWALK